MTRNRDRTEQRLKRESRSIAAWMVDRDSSAASRSLASANTARPQDCTWYARRCNAAAALVWWRWRQGGGRPPLLSVARLSPSLSIWRRNCARQPWPRVGNSQNKPGSYAALITTSRPRRTGGASIHRQLAGMRRTWESDIEDEYKHVNPAPIAFALRAHYTTSAFYSSSITDNRT